MNNDHGDPGWKGGPPGVHGALRATEAVASEFDEQRTSLSTAVTGTVSNPCVQGDLGMAANAQASAPDAPDARADMLGRSGPR